MRDIALLIGVLGALSITLFNPFAGTLLWTWFSLQNPHQEVFDFARTANLNLVIACATIFIWLLSSERKLPPLNTTSILLFAFVLWSTVNSIFAFDPTWSWPFWLRTCKIFVLGYMVAVTANSRLRLYALMWVCAISLLYFGIKGGIFTILTGGHYHVFGPPSTIIGDNNQLALALLMSLPLANFLRTQVSRKIVANGLSAAMLLTVVAIAGSYSRGAIIGLGLLASLMLLRGRRRFLYFAVAIGMIIFLVQFMPDAFFSRVDSIQAAQSDQSFQGRVLAWRVSYLYAADHFPFGAGFYGTQLSSVFDHYFPGSHPLAAHSIYFQVLGEQGFIGLGLYFCILGSAFLTIHRIVRRARDIVGLKWAKDLAIALQASLLVFCVAGSALSMAYYDLFVVEVAALLPLWEIVSPRKRRGHVPNEATQVPKSLGSVETASVVLAEHVMT